MDRAACGVPAVAFSPDGSHILTASSDDTAVLIDIGGAPIAALEGHTGDITSAVFSPDGSRILTGSTDSDARLWDLDGTSFATPKAHTAPLELRDGASLALLSRRHRTTSPENRR